MNPRKIFYTVLSIRSHRILAIFAASLLSHGTSALGQTDYTWTSPANSDWGVAGNWSPLGGPPAAIDNVVGVDTGSTTVGTALVQVDRAINDINLTTMSGNWAITGPSSGSAGSTLSVGGSVTHNPSVFRQLSFTDGSTALGRTLTLNITNQLRAQVGTINLGTQGTILTSVTVNGSTLVDTSTNLNINAGTASLGQTTVNGAMRIAFPSASTTGSRTVTVANLNGSGAVEANTNIQTALTANLVIAGTTAGNFSGVIRNANQVSNTGSTVTVTKNGAETQTFSGNNANTYTGLTTVNNGILALNKNNIAIGGDVRIAGGTLRLDNSNQILDSSDMELAGGTFSTGATTGFAEQLTTLTLANTATINFGSGDHVLRFADAGTWNGAGTLNITGWQGTVGGPGTAGRFVFTTGLSGGQLSQINFAGFSSGATQIAFAGGGFEIAPVPEPGTGALLGASLLLLALRRRRLQRA